MSLVVGRLLPKNLIVSSLRSRVVVKMQFQNYYALTPMDFKRNSYLHVYSNVKCNCNVLSTVGKCNYSVSNPNEPENEDKKEEKKLSLFQKFKNMYRDYWYVLVPVHIITSAVWLGGFYYVARSGVDVPSLLETLHFSEKIVNSMRSSSLGYFAITYGLYKISAPFRYTVTLGGTTISINYLTKWGYIKPVPSKERLKEMYVETKEVIKEKGENVIESVQKGVIDTKVEIKEKKESIITSVRESKDSIKRKVIGSATSQKQQNK
ncbi:hypothetical protein ABEB36_013104 [Hypothenemus hampei]|uniref:DUF1279 domain-containing protein n=1 Tax=Hypothenemus hampei TaxID=57062 RepID=A0ABD1E9J8_HYPHA